MNEKEELINELERMGNVCINIVIALHTHGKLRFNQLYRAIREYGVKISRPTFLENLRRLVKNKWVIREKEEAQKVFYYLNEDKAKALKISPEETKEILETLKIEEPFISELPDEALYFDIETDIKWLVQAFLEELRAEITFRLKHPKESEISEYLWFKKSVYRMHARLLIQKCLENMKFRMEFLEKIEGFIKKLREA